MRREGESSYLLLTSSQRISCLKMFPKLLTIPFTIGRDDYVWKKTDFNFDFGYSGGNGRDPFRRLLATSAPAIGVPTAIAHHLFPFIGDVGAQPGQPLDRAGPPVLWFARMRIEEATTESESHRTADLLKGFLIFLLSACLLLSTDTPPISEAPPLALEPWLIFDPPILRPFSRASRLLDRHDLYLFCHFLRE